ncbi:MULTISPECIES: glycosyltransferase [Nocardioides]|uniref:Glycosyltransferase n=1 Tax=Nocardioides vastitatis TaxID=2568655 RepID=A0ABW0ZAZ8_9ACTN|nr:glycosyltransferase [Nocardioides sp.]
MVEPFGRMAIAHEWVSARAGSEKVFEELARVFTEADLYALTMTPGVELDTDARDIRTTILDRLGTLRDRRDLLLPVMPLAWRVMATNERYDTVITSSHACAKGFRPARAARHLCYVHAPMRYVWNPEIDNRGARKVAAPIRVALRRWDRNSVRWVDSFAANSSAVADRIQRFYGRQARIIHPPVDTSFFAAAPVESRDGLVTLGRLIPYKGHDIAIKIAARLNLRIKVVGRGPDEMRLRRLASDVGAKADFIVDANDEEVRAAVASSVALIFAAVEDFGIVPVEAQAAGTPVVGPGLGGLRDTVLEGQTGVFADDSSVDAVERALLRLLDSEFSDVRCREHAARFGIERFRSEVLEWVAATAGGA